MKKKKDDKPKSGLNVSFKNSGLVDMERFISTGNNNFDEITVKSEDSHFVNSKDVIDASGKEISADTPNSAGNHKWYQKPVGLIFIAVVSGLIVSVVSFYFFHGE